MLEHWNTRPRDELVTPTREKRTLYTRTYSVGKRVFTCSRTTTIELTTRTAFLPRLDRVSLVGSEGGGGAA